MTQQRKSNNNRRRPNNNNGRPNANNNNRASGNNNNRPNNKNSRRPNMRRRRGNGKKNINLDPLFKKYTSLLEEMIQARKKYFEQFYRADELKKEKIETNYLNKIAELTTFKEGLSPEDLEKLIAMFPDQNLDITYSENHGLDASLSEVSVKQIEDPHYLESQKQANFENDTEESVGSFEDYKAYKGL